MRALTSIFIALPASGVLVAACDSPQPLGPMLTADDPRAAVSASPLAAPSNAGAAASSETQIDITWQDNASNETGFEVHRSGAGETGTFGLLTTLAANAVAYSDTGLQYGQQYCYRVRAVRVTGKKASSSAFSNTACSTTTPLAAPSNANAVLSSQTEIHVSWQDNSDSETGFELRLYGVLLATTAVNTTAYTHAGLAPHTSYCYQVRAFRATGNDTTYSAFSYTACALTPMAPATSVLGILVQPQTSTGVYVNWVGASNATSYGIYRSTDGGILWNLVGSVSYLSTLYFWDEPLPSEQRVCYRVVASNEMGDAPPSPTACTTPLAAPTSLTAIAVDAGTTRLTWNDNSAVEDIYQVWSYWSYEDCYGSVSEGFHEELVLAAELPANSTAFSIAHGPTSVMKSYWVVATTRDGGTSDPSDQVVVPVP